MKQDFKRDLEGRLYKFAVQIVRLVQSLPADTASRELGRQLVRSGTSVTANVVEARAASSRKDYINFYTHALKSANETTLWLHLMKDTLNARTDRYSELANESQEIANILGASVRTMKRNTKSSKF